MMKLLTIKFYPASYYFSLSGPNILLSKQPQSPFLLLTVTDQVSYTHEISKIIVSYIIS